MKIKTKLRLGFGFLFAVVIFFGALSLYYVNEIAKSSRVILKDNYESLSYTRHMRQLLDDASFPLDTRAAKQLDHYIDLELKNITEPGEKAAAGRLASAYNKLIAEKANRQTMENATRELRAHLRAIEDVNMSAIVRKHEKAQRSVQQTTMLLGFAATFTFLILFSFSVNFPGFISGPLRKLQEGILQISKKNYGARLHFEQNDEFADVAKAFNDMAGRLNEWENSNLATVLSEKRRIEAIIGQMQDAIIGVNEQQQVLFINSSARDILNLNDASEGQHIAQLMEHNDLLRSIINSQTKGKPFRIVVNGKESHFQLETREITVPNLQAGRTEGISIASQPAGKVYVLKNITEFKELDEAKTNFIATISHELKTPISAIKMSVKLLGDERVGSLNHEQQQLIKHISEDTQRLLKITYELLDLSQVETGNIQLNFMAARPEQIVDYAIKAVQVQAAQKEVAIETLIPENLPAVQADVEKSAWVLVNFLSNALRYSPERSRILVEVVPKKTGLEFSVRDFGKGIEAQYQKRLFDRYFQVPTDGQNKSGSGLGLAISREFIAAQGGSIGVNSDLGEGSRFYFTLPQATKQA